MCSPEPERAGAADGALRELASALGEGMAGVRAFVGAEIVEAVAISTLRRPDALRTAFRIATRDGRRFKLRRLRTEADAHRIERILAHAGEARFSRALACLGPLLIEEWIEGTPLTEAELRREHVEEAAHVLGSLHAISSFDSQPLHQRIPVSGELASLEANLALLELEGALDGTTTAGLLAAARAHQPDSVETGIVHGDCCLENMILDERGQLRVVDNEGLKIGPLDLDLVRVWYRWPMDAGRWEAFLAAYAVHRDPRPALEHALFWKIRVLAKSARLRRVREMRQAEVPLTRLRGLLG